MERVIISELEAHDNGRVLVPLPASARLGTWVSCSELASEDI